MKKLILLVLLVSSTCAYADTYNVYKFSPLKLTVNFEKFVFQDTVFSINGNDIEHKYLTPFDICAYIPNENGASLLWFMKKEGVIFGWCAEIKEKYNFNFYIIYGVIDEH